MQKYLQKSHLCLSDGSWNLSDLLNHIHKLILVVTHRGCLNMKDFSERGQKYFPMKIFLPPGSLRRSSGLSLTLSQQQQTLLKSLLMMIFIEKDWKMMRDKMLSTWSVRNDWGVWGSVSCTTTDWSLNFLREFHQPRKINCCLQLQVVRTVLLNIEINNYGLLCNSFLCKSSTTLTPLQ